MTVLFLRADARSIPLANLSVNCVVTSPPYWGLRNYDTPGQIGLEPTLESYIETMVQVFREVRRVLRDDGTIWVNMGDSYSGSWARSSTPGGTLENSPKQRTNVGSHAGDHDCEIIPAGLKPKDMIGMPWMLAFALRADGWYLRADIIWSKPNPMPESVRDRPTKAHEYIFLLSKSEQYYYDFEAQREAVSGNAHSRGDGVNPKARATPAGWDTSTGAGGHGKIHKEGRNSRMHVDRDVAHLKQAKCTDPRVKPGDRFGHTAGWRNKQNESFSAAVSGLAPGDKRNRRSVWEVPTQSFSDAHFATFPEALIQPCILAGCPVGGTVLDPFMGSGTTALVARANGCNAVGLELNPEYIGIARKRLRQSVLEFGV